MELRALVRFIRNRARVILALAALGGAAGFGIASLSPRMFRADGLMLVDTEEINIPDFQNLRSRGTLEPWGARSAARVLVSREVVGAVARKLHLDTDREFNPALRPGLIESVLPERTSQALTHTVLGAEHPSPSDIWTDIVESIRRRLTVDSEEHSYAITLGFTARDAVSAARLVNAVMEEFVAQELAVKRNAVIAAGAQLQQESKQLRVSLEDAWAKIRSLESRVSSLATMTGTVAAQKLVALSQEEQSAETERARVKADLDQIEAARSEQQSILLNPDLVTPRLKALLANEALLRQRSAETAAQVGPAHPRMRAINRAAGRVSGEVAAEMEAIRSSLRQRLASLQARGDKLKAEAAESGRLAAASAGDRAALEQWRSKAQSWQQLFETYQTRYYQTLASLQVMQPSIRIASRAVAPTKPSTPGRGLLTVVGGALGAALALAWMLGGRWLAGKLETLSDVSTATGLPSLGGIPRVGGGPFRAAASEVRRARALVAETIRGILLHVRSAEDPPPKVIMVASPQAGDGKTSFSLSMARIAARDGLRTICVDADFRRPALADRAGLGLSDCALNDVLEETAELGDAVTVDPVSGAHICAARPVRGVPFKLLQDARLDRFFRVARSQYDLVVVDTPPVLHVIDPLLIAPFVDAVVLVVAQGSATRDTVGETVQRLVRARAKIAGAVMAKVGGRMPEEYVYAGYTRR